MYVRATVFALAMWSIHWLLARVFSILFFKLIFLCILMRVGKILIIIMIDLHFTFKVNSGPLNKIIVLCVYLLRSLRDIGHRWCFRLHYAVSLSEELFLRVLTCRNGHIIRPIEAHEGRISFSVESSSCGKINGVMNCFHKLLLLFLIEINLSFLILTITCWVSAPAQILNTAVQPLLLLLFSLQRLRVYRGIVRTWLDLFIFLKLLSNNLYFVISDNWIG